MTAQTFSLTVDKLSAALSRWADQTQPLEKGEYFRLHGVDQSNRTVGLDDLFFVDDDDHFRPQGGAGMYVLNQELINTSTLRNSFFPQIFNAHCEILDVSLHLVFQGRFQVIVYQSRQDQDPVPLTEIIVASDEMGSEVFPICALNTLPRGARLFWVARALSDACVLFDATWEARAPAATEGRMVVLIRTFGRTRDVQNLLNRFQEQAGDSDYGQMLQNTFFLIYDASVGVGPQTYADFAQNEQLNTFVLTGPNLGGGGNMSLELLTLQQAVQAAGITVNELVMTDDDLSISLESLARNWAATLFRRDNAFHTLPVFMQSEPRRMWEDGGFWGRYTHESPRGQRTSVAPRLLRHAKVFSGQEHLNDMARLHHAEYSTFIFLSMPFVRLAEIGFPTAFFLRGDDIEYNLRNAAAGGVTVSNPNMAAWHEPAHSYAQEYMAIAHGVIINMAYGQRKPDDLATFFHTRAGVHIALSDVAGLSVYAEALADLVACDRLLQPDFAPHYLAMMARFRSLDAAFSVMPDELVQSVKDSSKREGKITVVAPFLYPDAHASEFPLDHVVLFNAHTERRCIYDPFDIERLAALSTVAARLYASLSVFIQRFDALRAHYRQRIAASTTAEFWLKEAEGKEFGVLYG